MKKYCVYLTSYLGEEFLPKNKNCDIKPKYYIGSSTIERVNGKRKYKGSVKSKQYKQQWESELKQNPQQFITEILSEFDTHHEAIVEELRLHIMLDVVKNPLFFNKSRACKNGFFGRDVSGSNHPLFGKPGKKGEQHPLFGKKVDVKVRTKISVALTGRITGPRSEETKIKISQAQIGKILSSETRTNIANAQRGKPGHSSGITFEKIECEHCLKWIAPAQFTRYHGVNCKKHPNNTIKNIKPKRIVKKTPIKKGTKVRLITINDNNFAIYGNYTKFWNDIQHKFKTNNLRKLKKHELLEYYGILYEEYNSFDEILKSFTIYINEKDLENLENFPKRNKKTYFQKLALLEQK